MEPRVDAIYEMGEGLRQFCIRHGHAVVTDEVRNAYHRWYLGKMRDWGEMDGARQEGRAEGIQIGRDEGIEIGRAETLDMVALKLLRLGMASDYIREATGITGKALKQLSEAEGVKLDPPHGPELRM
jgi:hypothetical protein